jgi:hypothetical protein
MRDKNSREKKYPYPYALEKKKKKNIPRKEIRQVSQQLNVDRLKERNRKWRKRRNR